MLLVIDVEKADLLLVMGGVIGGIHVQDNDIARARMGLLCNVSLYSITLSYYI
jgi:hypothetical protein